LLLNQGLGLGWVGVAGRRPKSKQNWAWRHIHGWAGGAKSWANRRTIAVQQRKIRVLQMREYPSTFLFVCFVLGVFSVIFG